MLQEAEGSHCAAHTLTVLIHVKADVEAYLLAGLPLLDGAA